MGQFNMLNRPLGVRLVRLEHARAGLCTCSSRDYAAFSKRELEDLLRNRRLSTSGDKNHLLARLQASDGRLSVVDETSVSSAETHQEHNETKKTARKTDKRRRKQADSRRTEELTEQISTKDIAGDQEAHAALLKLKKAELQEIASTLGLPRTGTKAELVKKILEKSPEAKEIPTKKGSKRALVLNAADTPQPTEAASEPPASSSDASPTTLEAALGHREGNLRETAEFLLTAARSSSLDGEINVGKFKPVRPADVVRMQARVAELKKELDLQQEEILKLTAGVEKSARDQPYGEARSCGEQNMQEVRILATDAESLSDTDDKDVTKGQGALGVAVAAGVLAVGRAVGQLFQRNRM